MPLIVVDAIAGSYTMSCSKIRSTTGVHCGILRGGRVVECVWLRVIFEYLYLRTQSQHQGSRSNSTSEVRDRVERGRSLYLRP